MGLTFRNIDKDFAPSLMVLVLLLLFAIVGGAIIPLHCWFYYHVMLPNILPKPFPLVLYNLKLFLHLASCYSHCVASAMVKYLPPSPSPYKWCIVGPLHCCCLLLLNTHHHHSVFCCCCYFMMLFLLLSSCCVCHGEILAPSITLCRWWN